MNQNIYILFTYIYMRNMEENNLYLLNTPILTEYGEYKFFKVSLEDAKKIIDRKLVGKGFISAIGHQATADFMSELFGITIPTNRISIHMKPRDAAIVFRLVDRLPEGKILSKEEMKEIKYEIGFLKMKSEF